MKINKVSLPYPVLSTGDDILPSLSKDSIVVEPVLENDKYRFYITLSHNDEEITRLIEEGYAEYTCEVTCPRTFLRRCIHSAANDFSFELSRREVFSTITMSCYVTVKKAIPEYKNPNFHEDYGDVSFFMEPGDILAAFPEATYNADLKYDKLYSAGAFMVVQEASNDCTQTWFDANGDRIIVYLPHEMFEQFKEFGRDRNFNELFHASIVFNGIVKILSEYDENTHGDLLWAEAIKYRIAHEDSLSEFDITDTSKAYELTQALLDDPYRRLFNHLKIQQED